jgi:8-oxo-dGTP pyrophosphatase MutT (NUDIX family)
MSRLISRKWILAKSILPKYQGLTVFQVYIWLISTDKKFIIVSTDGENWQFPGGEPKLNESIIETIIREVQEETGLDIKQFTKELKIFGFYVIEDIENGKRRKYLQVRCLLPLQDKSTNLHLQPRENPSDPEPIEHLMFVDREKAEKLIPWLKGSEEMKTITRKTP